MGGRNPGRRTRALGTRGRVLSYLADGEIGDPKGMASTVLAEAVGYPGSSAAFAQLLSGMERSGLIEREIRGKRTYRIAATATGHNGQDAAGPGRRGENALGSGPGGADSPRSRRHPEARGADSWRLCSAYEEGQPRDLFVEPPEGWWLKVRPAHADGQDCFTLTIGDKPKDAALPIKLILTLTGGASALETTVDAPPS